MSNIILDAFTSLGSKINKITGKSEDIETKEGVVSEKLPELSLEMDNETLVNLTDKWKKTWEESEVYSEWLKLCEENENYWKGKQHNQSKVDKTRPMVDNVIFESVETYLPQVTRRNPEPTSVLARKEEQSPKNLEYAKELQKELGELADELILRLKLKKVARHWVVYLLGAAKFGWDLNRDIPTLKVIRPKKLILDPESTNDEDGYSGSFIGEPRKMKASDLISLLESVGGESEGIKKIKEMAVDSSGNPALGTNIGFIEWWTNEYMCWRLGDKILLKKKNPHWNYETEKEAPYNEMGTPQVNPDGTPLMEKVPGFNHFQVPKMPYLFLTVFNLGKQPIDETSLITQNLANQDLINKRNKQMDKNADSMNNGMVVSGERSGLTQQQAKGVSDALRKGGVVWIPTGNVSDAVVRMSAPGLPSDIYNQVIDTRNRMRDIFGVRGSTPAGIEGEKTVRGKFQNKQLDTDRIGGGFSEYLEQYADGIYNWFVQLLYVYSEEFAGKPHPRVRIGVKEGSLLPKDSAALASQAIDLAAAGQMSLIDLYKKLDYPNAEEMAANVWLQTNAPEVLFTNDPRVQQVIKARQNANTQERPPSESISFSDLPAGGKAQMAAKVGIQISPEEIELEKEKEQKSAEEKRSIPLPKINKEI